MLEELTLNFIDAYGAKFTDWFPNPEPEELGNENNYKDDNGVIHIAVSYESSEYELKDGLWVERMPF